MNEIKYLLPESGRTNIEGEFVESKEAMEWMKKNNGVFVECNNCKKYVYKEGYFIRYVHCNIGKGWYRLPYKYVPRSDFEESVRDWVVDIVRHESDSWSKQWCPV